MKLAPIIYALCDPMTGEPRYIGKSKHGVRRAEEHASPRNLRRRTRTHVRSWCNALAKVGRRPVIAVLAQFSVFDNETLNAAERYWIRSMMDRGCALTNLTSGGDGSAGRAWSDYDRAIASSRTRDQWANPEKRKRIENAVIAAAGSSDLREIRSEAMRRRWADPSGRAKLLAGVLPTRAAVGDALRGRPRPRSKTSIEHQRATLSRPEVRKRYSDSAKRRMAVQREKQT